MSAPEDPRPSASPPEKADKLDDATAAGEVFANAVAIMARLRGPEGCPWDREQDFDSIRKHTIEEAYEVLDAIERRNWPDLKEELGDLLLQVLFYSQMAAEPGYFTISDVVDGLNRKLVRRHPHVFGDEASREAGNVASDKLEISGIDAQQVLRNWDAIKSAEKFAAAQDQGAPHSKLDSIPRSMPALMEAAKLGSRAAKSGFDWPDAEGLFTKIDEETGEIRDAMSTKTSSLAKDAVAEELGDLLFTVVNLARHLNVDPELALRQSNTKFRRRFRSMELESSIPLENQTSDKLESLWASAKRSEASSTKSV